MRNEAPTADDASRRATVALWLFGLILPLALLLLATALIRAGNLDRRLVGLWYGPGEAQWPYLHWGVCRAVYDWAPLPALLMGVGCSITFAASLYWRSLKAWRWPSLFCCLVLWIGPGILINTVLKPYIGRPRPVEIVEFGGTLEFKPVLTAHFHKKRNSFPCGHASMGFVLMAPAFFLYRRHPRWGLFFLMLGVTLGAGFGLSRIIQGKHYPSDVLWSGAVVYFTAFLLHILFRYHRTPRDERASSKRTGPSLHAIRSEHPNKPLAAPRPWPLRKEATRR